MSKIFGLLFLTYLRVTYGGIVVPPTRGELDWWQNAIIYEIFPMSFKDSNGDGSGDFNGITEKLDYLVDIGVTAIWLTPFLESPLQSAGYDITDYKKVQKLFGSMEDFENLLNTAHEKELKVIMDFVPNHTSNKHVWFQNSVNNAIEYSDYYIWKDAKNIDEWKKNNTIKPVVPNNWKSICGAKDFDSAWIWDGTRKQFYFTQFLYNLPDLNFRNNKVNEEMKSILKYWVKLGIDGIRIDALRHVYESDKMEDEPVIDSSLPEEYLNLNHIYTTDQVEVYGLIEEWHLVLEEFKQKDGNTRIIMTESYSPLEVLFKYYTSGAEIPTNFNLMDNKLRRSPSDFDKEIQDWITKMPNGSTYNVVLQNHDSPRISTIYGTFLNDGLNALSLFLPGVAIVYYGGEIGMEDLSDESNFSRGPMQWDNTKYAGFTDNNETGPWIAIHPNYKTINVKTEYSDSKSHLNFFKRVAKLRRTETLKRGGLATYIFNDTVFVLNRFLPGNENYTLVINMDSNSQNVRLSDQMPNLNSSLLSVVVGSGNSNFTPGDAVFIESLTLSPGATVILTDHKTTESTTPSSSTPGNIPKIIFNNASNYFCPSFHFYILLTLLIVIIFHDF